MTMVLYPCTGLPTLMFDPENRGLEKKLIAGGET